MGWNEIEQAASLIRRTPITTDYSQARGSAPRIAARSRSLIATAVACAMFGAMGTALGATVAGAPSLIPVAEASEHILSIRFEHEADATAFYEDRKAEGESVCLTYLPLENATRHWVHSC